MGAGPAAEGRGAASRPAPGRGGRARGRRGGHGRVTLTVNERGADYGLSVFPSTWDAAEKDITTGPAQGVIRYGLVRDTGKDDAPVPQYVTRATPADPATVPQRSRV